MVSKVNPTSNDVAGYGIFSNFQTSEGQRRLTPKSLSICNRSFPTFINMTIVSVVPPRIWFPAGKPGEFDSARAKATELISVRLNKGCNSPNTDMAE